MQKRIAAISAVVGLGNPGKEYKDTRHNVGFQVVDRLLEQLPKKGSLISGCYGKCEKRQFAGKSIYLLKPETYMNLSGIAVSALTKRLNLLPEEVLIVYDDMDLPLGRMRIRAKGGSGGHNGIKSIIEHLGCENFPRLRIGIGQNKSVKGKEFILSEFTEEEKEILDKILELSTFAIKISIRKGLHFAMNQYNSVDLRMDKKEGEKIEDL